MLTHFSYNVLAQLGKEGKKMLDMLQIKYEDVIKVYNGKHGCMCGCVGNWHYNDERYMPDYGVVNKRACKVNTTRVNKLLTRSTKDLAMHGITIEYGKDLDGNDWVFMSTDTRKTVIYYRKSA